MNIQETQWPNPFKSDPREEACITMHIHEKHHRCDGCGENPVTYYTIDVCYVSIKEQHTCRHCGFKHKPKIFALQ